MIQEDLWFIQRFFYQVYSKLPSAERRFKNYSDLASWIETTIGPRESNNHFLYLTGYYDSPVEWVLITNWKELYRQALLPHKPMTQILAEKEQQLLEHLLREEYISNANQMSSFIKSISERFYRQLLDDMTYKNEEP